VTPSATRRVRAASAVLLVLAVVAAYGAGWGSPAWYALPALALAVSLSEVAVVTLQFGRQRWALSLTEGVIAAALVLCPGGWTAVAVALGVTLAQTALRRPGLKLRYNVAQFSLGTALAALVAVRLDAGVAGVCVALLVFWLFNHSSVALVIALTTGARLSALGLTGIPMSLVHTAGNSSIGLLAAYLAVHAPLGLAGLIVPLALLWSSYEQQTRRSGEARLFAELARGQERATARSTDVSAQVVLTAAARLFGEADVEMVLLAAEGPVLWVGDADGTPRRLRVDPDAFDEPWVLRALGSRGVDSGVDEGRPWCSAVLGEPQAPLAVLIARRSAGAAPFGREETRLAQVLVVQAESWLSVSNLSEKHRTAAQQAAAADGAARALGDLGAATTPALTVLRDSAARLAQLAEASAAVDDIVSELHLVERAVASLLGAIALAAEPELQTGRTGVTPDQLVDGRRATDWTTTGVLR
jgi:hypothetical protein